MAVDFDGENTVQGSTDWLHNLPNLTGELISAGGWFYLDAWWIYRGLFSTGADITSSGTIDARAYLADVAGHVIFDVFQVTEHVTYDWDVDLDTTYLDKWVHLLWTYSWTTENDAICYLNGVDQGAPVPVGNPSGGRRSNIDSLRIGNGDDGNGAFHGHIAEVAIWNSILSAGEVAALASGLYSPLQIDLANLALYAPLYHSTGTEIISGIAGSNTATTYTVPHPPVQQAIIPILQPPRISPHALPARINMRDDTSLVPSRDYWGPHVYRRGNRT